MHLLAMHIVQRKLYQRIMTSRAPNYDLNLEYTKLPVVVD